MSDNAQYWPRFIAFVDMDAFFASIEQSDNPEYRGKPIGITNGLTGTCFITCSYEARTFGIHIGMRLKKARKLCPDIVRVPSRPERYVEVSARIMRALQDITPDVEVFSVDEAFLDLTHCQRYWDRSPWAMGEMIKQRVREVSGLPCTVGLSGDKTTAKYAAKQKKPDGMAMVAPWEARDRLRDVPVIELCGVNQGIAGFLARRGAITCGEVAGLPVSVLGDRFGNPGRRIWQMCRGEDPSPGRDPSGSAQKPRAREGHASGYERPGCDLHVPGAHGREAGHAVKAAFTGGATVLCRVAYPGRLGGQQSIEDTLSDQRQPAGDRVMPPEGL